MSFTPWISSFSKYNKPQDWEEFLSALSMPFASGSDGSKDALAFCLEKQHAWKFWEPSFPGLFGFHSDLRQYSILRQWPVRTMRWLVDPNYELISIPRHGPVTQYRMFSSNTVWPHMARRPRENIAPGLLPTMQLFKNQFGSSWQLLSTSQASQNCRPDFIGTLQVNPRMIRWYSRSKSLVLSLINLAFLLMVLVNPLYKYAWQRMTC